MLAYDNRTQLFALHTYQGHTHACEHILPHILLKHLPQRHTSTGPHCQCT
jgi:hypothetical protein